MRLIDADAIQIPSTYVDMFENCRNCKLLDREQVREIIDAQPTIEPKAKVVAQVTFDEEKLREIVKKAVERFKGEYEITDRPQGEWVPSDTDGFVCSVCKNGYRNQPTLMGRPMFEYCPVCGARMKGSDDDL